MLEILYDWDSCESGCGESSYTVPDEPSVEAFDEACCDICNMIEVEESDEAELNFWTEDGGWSRSAVVYGDGSWDLGPVEGR